MCRQMSLIYLNVGYVSCLSRQVPSARASTCVYVESEYAAVYARSLTRIAISNSVQPTRPCHHSRVTCVSVECFVLVPEHGSVSQVQPVGTAIHGAGEWRHPFHGTMSVQNSGRTQRPGEGNGRDADRFAWLFARGVGALRRRRRAQSLEVQ